MSVKDLTPEKEQEFIKVMALTCLTTLVQLGYKEFLIDNAKQFLEFNGDFTKKRFEQQLDDFLEQIGGDLEIVEEEVE